MSFDVNNINLGTSAQNKQRAEALMNSPERKEMEADGPSEPVTETTIVSEKVNINNMQDVDSFARSIEEGIKAKAKASKEKQETVKVPEQPNTIAKSLETSIKVDNSTSEFEKAVSETYEANNLKNPVKDLEAKAEKVVERGQTEEKAEMPLTDIQKWIQLGYNPREVDLPSNSMFYIIDGEGKVIIRDLSINELMLIASVRGETNLRGLYEALGRTILNFPWTEMLNGDFRWLFYYHRLRSQEGDAFHVDWVCENEKHLEDVANNIVPEKTLENKSAIEEHHFKNIHIKEEALELVDALPNFILHPTRVADFLDMDEMISDIRATIRPESTAAEIDNINQQVKIFSNYVNFASVLSPNETQGYKLGDRVRYLKTTLENMTRKDMNHALQTMTKFKKLSNCGVEEYVEVTCGVGKEGGCGKKQRVYLDFDPAEQFLPFDLGEFEEDFV